MASVQVQVSDVQARYEGDLTAQFGETYIQTQIADAVDYADARWSAQIEARLASGVLTSNLYKRIVADAVLRVIRNPGGLASENDGSYGYATRAVVASGNLWYTDADQEILTGAPLATRPRSVRIGLVHNPVRRWR
jgi:hypothetical protein